MHATETCDVKHIQLLINQGTDVNHRCRFGITPLFLAIMTGHLDLCECFNRPSSKHLPSERKCRLDTIDVCCSLQQ